MLIETRYNVDREHYDTWADNHGDLDNVRREIKVRNFKDALWMIGFHWPKDRDSDEYKAIPVFIRADGRAFTQEEANAAIDFMNARFTERQAVIDDCRKQCGDHKHMHTIVDCNQDGLDAAKKLVADWVEAFEYLKAVQRGE